MLEIHVMVGKKAHSKHCIQMVVHYWRQQGAGSVRDCPGVSWLLVELLAMLMAIGL